MMILSDAASERLRSSSHGCFDNVILACAKSANDKSLKSMSTIWSTKVLRSMKLPPLSFSRSTSPSFLADGGQAINSKISDELCFF